MTIIDVLNDKLLHLQMINKEVNYIYLGESEYMDLRERAKELCDDYLDVFMGVEVVRVNRNNHINVA